MGVGWDDGRSYRTTNVHHPKDMQPETGMRYFVEAYFDNPVKSPEVVRTFDCHGIYPRMAVCLACGIRF